MSKLTGLARLSVRRFLNWRRSISLWLLDVLQVWGRVLQLEKCASPVKLSKAISRSQGKDMLFILAEFDELPPHLRQSDFHDCTITSHPVINSIKQFKLQGNVTTCNVLLLPYAFNFQQFHYLFVPLIYIEQCSVIHILYTLMIYLYAMMMCACVYALSACFQVCCIYVTASASSSSREGETHLQCVVCDSGNWCFSPSHCMKDCVDVLFYRQWTMRS